MCAASETRCAASLGRCWVTYGLGGLVAERRSGTREMGRQVALRTGAARRLGAGVRGVLG